MIPLCNYFQRFFFFHLINNNPVHLKKNKNKTMEVRDSIYCFEIARRSVGRAALHLGIESMTEEALDVMADILLTYLSRVGKTLSHLVEASGRSSAHVHTLDAFQAVQLVASPAIQRLHLLESPDEGDQLVFATNTSTMMGNPSNPTASLVSQNQPNWKGLAAFCFGPKWLEEDDDDEKNPEASLEYSAAEQVAPTGGKRGPSASVAALMNDPTNPNAAKPTTSGGWEAPYLDEVPHFPQASDECANPHPLPPHVGLSLHNTMDQENDEDAARELLDTTDQQLQAVPDGAFFSSSVSWGSLSANKKRKLDDDESTAAIAASAATTAEKATTAGQSTPSTPFEGAGDAKDSTVASPPPAKKVKLDDGSAALKTDEKKKDKKGEMEEAKKDASNVTTGSNSRPDDDLKHDADEGKEAGDLSSSGNTQTKQFFYVPSFYPPAPSTILATAYARSVVDSASNMILATGLDAASANPAIGSNGTTVASNPFEPSAKAVGFTPATESDKGLHSYTTSEITHGLRSSLVQLGSYWGSGWDVEDFAKTSTSNPSTLETAKRLAVPLGRAEGEISTPIVPVVRYSGSRVSRILEGSMDAAAMQ